MASTIKPRRGSTTPTTGIVENELVVDTTNKRIYIGNVGGSGDLVGSAPGGANTNVQFNDSGNFSGDANFTYNKTTDTLTINGTTNSLDIVSSTDGVGLRIAQGTTGGSSTVGGIRLGRGVTSTDNTYIENNGGIFSVFNGNDYTGTLLFACDVINDSATYSLSKLVLNGSAAGEIRLYEPNAGGSNYLAIKAAATVAANITWTLPSADGSSGQVLSTNGSGTLSWATAGGGSGITRSINNISSTTSAGSTASTDYVYNVTSGTFTLTMPTAVSNTNKYTIKQSGTGTLTIATTSSQTIDGKGGYTIDTQYQSIDLVSDGTNWIIV